MEGHILLMIVTKYFQHREGTSGKLKALSLSPKCISPYLVVDKCHVMYLIQKYPSSCSSSFVLTTFLKIESDCNSFSSFVKNLFQIFSSRKEIQYFVDFREIALRGCSYENSFPVVFPLNGEKDIISLRSYAKYFPALARFILAGCQMEKL